MFRNAGSFNQNLCLWKDKADSTKLDIARDTQYMFTSSDCLDTTSPSVLALSDGPWCHVCACCGVSGSFEAFQDEVQLKSVINSVYTDPATIGQYGPINCWDVSGVTTLQG